MAVSPDPAQPAKCGGGVVTTDLVTAARRIAEELGVPWGDLTEELPRRQVVLIRDRVARMVDAERTERYLRVQARLGDACPRCEGSHYVPVAEPEGRRLFEPCSLCATATTRGAAREAA